MKSSKNKSSCQIGGKLVPVELAYKTYEVKNGKPDKSPLVIHHSLLGSKKNWKKVAKEIHHVTKRTVVSVDARNHGDSPHARYTVCTLGAQICSQCEPVKIQFCTGRSEIWKP